MRYPAHITRSAAGVAAAAAIVVAGTAAVEGGGTQDGLYDPNRVISTREGPYLRMLPAGGAKRLGVTAIELPPQLADYFAAKDGVLVTEVRHWSPANRAGVKAGDIITGVDRAPVKAVADLNRALDRDLNGTRLWLDVTRDKRNGRIEVKIPKPY